VVEAVSVEADVNETNVDDPAIRNYFLDKIIQAYVPPRERGGV